MPPARIGDAHNHARAQGQAGFRLFWDLQQELCCALAIGHGSRQLEELFAETLVGLAEAVPRMLGERVGIDHKPPLAFHRQPAARRAVEEIRLHADALAGALAQHDIALAQLIFARAKADAQPLWDEVFHRERNVPGDLFLAIDNKFRAPHAARSAAVEIDVLGNAACRHGFSQANPARLGAVGAIDHERRLPVIDGASDAIADQPHQPHPLAGAVDAAFGVEIGINIARAVTPVDAAVGKIERRALQIERGEIALRAVGHDIARPRRTFAVHQSFVEMNAAFAVGARARQFFVVLRDQGQRRARERTRRAQRTRHDIETARAIEALQRHVGIDDPAIGRGARFVVALATLTGAWRIVAHLHDVSARAHFPERRPEREYARHRHVALTRIDSDRTFVNLHADILASALEAPIIPAALFVDLADIDVLLREDAVGYAQHLDFEFADVHGFDGKSIGFRARQDHAIAGKAHISRAVAKGEGKGFVVSGALAIGGGQPLADGDLALRLERQPPEAEQVAGHVGLEVRRRLDREEVSVVDRGVGG